MVTRGLRQSAWALVLVVSAILIVACVPDLSPPQLSFPVKEQEVPAVLAIGPVDTSKVTFEGQPASENAEGAMQTTIKDTLTRTQIFKDIVILKADKKADPEQLLAAARAQNADLLLMGEFKDFVADAPSAFGSRFEINTRFQAKLFNVHNGAQVWKKTEKVQVAKDGSGFKKQESLDAIVRGVAIPPITAGILPPMVEYLQTEYLASLKSPAKGAVAENSEVLLLGSVAVAEMNSPADTLAVSVVLIVALPLASVVTLAKPRYRSPSP